MIPEQVKKDNEEYLVRLGSFLQGEATLDPDDVDFLAETYSLSVFDSAHLMLAAQLGLDLEQKADQLTDERYLLPGFHILSPERYEDDLYRKMIFLPPQTYGNWAFDMKTFQPFEVFVCGDLVCAPDGREIPQIGAFQEAFDYPVLMQNGREWMTLAPVEIESMREHIDRARGNVLTIGLGMGYYLFHTIMKPEVSHVTVIEKDPNLIQMFREVLLPQFPERNKTEIICMDAYDYLDQKEVLRNYDEIFCDFWHDAGDGYLHYERLKAIEREQGIQMHYWVENMLSQMCRLMSSSGDSR